MFVEARVWGVGGVVMGLCWVVMGVCWVVMVRVGLDWMGGGDCEGKGEIIGWMAEELGDCRCCGMLQITKKRGIGTTDSL